MSRESKEEREKREHARLLHLRDIYRMISAYEGQGLQLSYTCKRIKNSWIYKVSIFHDGFPITVCYLSPPGKFPKPEDFPI